MPAQSEARSLARSIDLICRPRAVAAVKKAIKVAPEGKLSGNEMGGVFGMMNSLTLAPPVLNNLAFFLDDCYILFILRLESLLIDLCVVCSSPIIQPISDSNRDD